MKFNRFWIKEDGVEYDDTRRRAAGQKAIIYYLVALYIGYMGFNIISGRLSGDDTMSYPLAIGITVAFFAFAIWIIWYATKRMKSEFEKSKIIEDKKEEEQQ